MSTELAVRAEGLAAEEVQQLTEDLAAMLNQDAGVPATLGTGKNVEGGKGDPITIGVIVVAAIKAGAVTKVVSVIGAWLNRSKKLEVTITKAGSGSVTVKSENISAPEREATIAELQRVLDD